jgi:hypothetical protein
MISNLRASEAKIVVSNLRSSFMRCFRSTALKGAAITIILINAPYAAADVRTVDQLLDMLNLDKPPIKFTDLESAPAPEGPVTVAVPADFGGGGGTLNSRGGSLVLLESTPPGGLPTDLRNLDAKYISDILLFLPNATSFFFYSDPFPDVFHVPTYDSSGAVTGEAFLSLADVLSTDNNRRVNTIQEGYLIDQRNNPPLGAGPTDIATNFGVSDVTIFVNRFTSSSSQAYVLLSDNPECEPASLVLLISGLAAFGAGRGLQKIVRS